MLTLYSHVAAAERELKRHMTEAKLAVHRFCLAPRYSFHAHRDAHAPADAERRQALFRAAPAHFVDSVLNTRAPEAPIEWLMAMAAINVNDCGSQAMLL